MQKLQIVDGEADESDYETDEQRQTPTNEGRKRIENNEKSAKRLQRQLNFINNNQSDPRTMRARVHVDEKLTQRWQMLGSDALTIVWKRNVPFIKKVEEMENTIDSTFNTLKTSTTTCRALSDNMSNLNDTVSSILQAATLLTLPDKENN